MAWRMAYDLVIPGEAVPQGRPRFGHGRTYDPPKSRRYKEYVRRLARKNMPPDALRGPLTCPVRLTCVIYRAVPQSWSRRKRADAIADKIRPTTRPDISNVIKGIEDALNNIWYKDDSQIVEYGLIGKWYAEEPRVYVRLVLGHTLSMFTDRVLKEHHKEKTLDDYQMMLISSFAEGFGYKRLANSIGLMFLLQNKYGVKGEDTAKQLEKALDEEIKSIKKKRAEKESRNDDT